MDEVYRSIYSDLFYRYGIPEAQEPVLPSSPDSSDIQAFLATVHDVREAIADTAARIQEETGREVRPDAQHLVLINMSELVLLPMHLAGRLTEAEGVTEDVALLLREAADASEEEVSGHSVIDALSANWRRLRIMDLNVWE